MDQWRSDDGKTEAEETEASMQMLALIIGLFFFAVFCASIYMFFTLLL